MRVLYPSYLLLLLLIGWFWYLARSTPPPRKRGAIVIRCAVVALLVLSAAGLEIRAGDEPLDVVFLVDRSDSMAGAASIEEVNALTVGAGASDRAAIIAFGANAVLERRLAPVQPIKEIASEIAASGTNIEGALRLARATLAPGRSGRIVLISDGRETAGSARAEAARAASAGVPVDIVETVQLPVATRRARIALLQAPPSVRVGEPFQVVAEIEGAPRSRVEVLLQRDGQPPLAREATLPDSGRLALPFHDQHRTSGPHVYNARVRSIGDDETITELSEESAGAVVTVAGRTNVLYASTAAGALSALLAANEFRVTFVVAQSVPRDAHALTAYDAIVLDDIPASTLEAAQAAAIAQHVERRGAGLLVLGSQRSLDAGALTEGPLGAVLPVDLRPRSGRRSPGAALAVVFDKSGSMADRAGGVPKIEIARQAVAKVLDVLPGTDALGVIAFDAAPTAIAPLAPGHSANALTSRLRTVEPSGATRIAPAMQLARDWLRGPSAAGFSKRHVLLVSDGRTTPDDAARVEAVVRGAGFEVTVVALGPESDRRVLTRLAEISGGRAYFPADLAQLPSILAREASRVAGGRLVEERFTARTASHPVATGLERYGAPTLSGYVVSASKPSAESILTSHLDDPILVGWRVGLGRAAVFTADLHGPWSSRMRAWSGFAPLWVQSLRWLSRTSTNADLHVRFEPAGNDMQVVVDIGDRSGRVVPLLNGHVSTGTPSGKTFDSTLEHVAPGRYTSKIPLTERGPYVTTVAARRSDGTEERLVRGFYWAADAEQLTGPDASALRQLADTTGGLVLKAGQSPFAMQRTVAYAEGWPWLTTAALLLFVGEVVSRRWRISRPTARLTPTAHLDRHVA